LKILIFFPFLIHGSVMFLDEFIYHHRRGLPAWERLGHPVDTLFFLSCPLFLLWAEPSATSAWVYLGLAVTSTLIITKDEAVHSKACCAKEQWLHSLLFVLHPIILGILALLWFLGAGALESPLMMTEVGESADWIRTFLMGYVLTISAFGVYQLVYWNWFRKEEGSDERRVD
jgi:hypothetical protein